ncbi:potassium channel family protein [Aspergillus thermomutatus]|uniref:Potassium channel domain-containing protein n=1 Tax=Aspergillus thermomutatus TaxID=41047 RepID=A0A397H2X8_ASPTH|nr:uncharacterized protein CDV56_107019 [Aspergillus thermomutatus]RHZ55763.1 hypothetical protein CDV56_107019 [Aspergillus thermomutatus]
MNDPELNGPISQVAPVFNRLLRGNQSGRKWASQAASPSSQHAKWWFLSTAFPLIAATLGPLASSFSICSLTEQWRSYTADGSLRQISVEDPTWYGISGFVERQILTPPREVAVNAISLFLALVANFLLLMNMGRRIRFSVAQPVVIVAWYTFAIMMIALLIVFRCTQAGPGRPGFHLSQAYYYGAFAAGLYFVIPTLLGITYYGASRGYYAKEFKLSPSQRTLMLQTIIFFIYLLGGAAVYSRIEGWRFLDALYWADFTLLTIGIGNLAPSSHLGRSLLFPFAIGGILILGMMIGLIRALMLEKGKQTMGHGIMTVTFHTMARHASDSQSRLYRYIPHLDQADKESERDRVRKEMMFLRTVKRIATLQRRWMSFLISFTVWMVMWLVGAAAFWKSESSQNWTYFEALYFSFTSLSTIGYGDIYPVSAWGVPFFVFWSLLAVPTLTILISTLGDTVVHGVRECIIFLGKATVFPEEKSTRGRLNAFIKCLIRGAPLADGHGGQSEVVSSPGQHSGSAHADDASWGDLRSYHCALFSNLHRLIELAVSGEEKEFSQDEWDHYLRLINRSGPLGAILDGSLSSDWGDSDGEKGHGPAREESGTSSAASGQKHNRGLQSLVQPSSPLLSGQTEAQWLLEAVAKTIKHELHKADMELCPQNPV